METVDQKTKIVILGNGFGGVYALKQLHKLVHKKENVELTLIGEKNYFLFTPLLHEVATGGQNQSNIVEPIRQVLGCCLNNFHLGRAEFINTREHWVRAGQTVLPYDYLVLATGAATNFYNVPGAPENALPLKSIEDAVRIKNRLIASIECALHAADRPARRKKLRFVVVGGGPTGVELAAEIAELVQDSFSLYYPQAVLDDVSILLVHRDKELVRQFGTKIRAKSLQILKSKSIQVMLGRAVQAVGPTQVLLDNGEKIDTETVIWVAGIKPRLPEFDVPVEQALDGRLLVNEFFELPNHKNIFAIGDVAAFQDKNSYLPALAQVAEKEARVLAQNLARLLSGQSPREFKYRHAGNLLSLGQWMAAGEIGSFTFSGRFAWWVWRTVYLFKFISWRKKFRVALDWTINLFSPRDISEL